MSLLPASLFSLKRLLFLQPKSGQVTACLRNACGFLSPLPEGHKAPVPVQVSFSIFSMNLHLVLVATGAVRLPQVLLCCLSLCRECQAPPHTTPPGSGGIPLLVLMLKPGLPFHSPPKPSWVTQASLTSATPVAYRTYLLVLRVVLVIH